MASLESELQSRFAAQRHRLRVMDRNSRTPTFRDEAENNDNLCRNKSTWQALKYNAKCVCEVVSFASSTRLFGLLFDILLQLFFVLLVSSAVLVMGAFSVVMTELSRMYSRRNLKRTKRQRTALMRRTIESTCLFVTAVLDQLDDDPDPVYLIADGEQTPPLPIEGDIVNTRPQHQIKCEGDGAPIRQAVATATTATRNSAETPSRTSNESKEPLSAKKDPTPSYPKPYTQSASKHINTQAVFSSVIGEIKKRALK